MLGMMAILAGVIALIVIGITIRETANTLLTELLSSVKIVIFGDIHVKEIKNDA